MPGLRPDTTARQLVLDWLKRVVSSPVHELSRWQRAIRYGLDLAYHCAGELRHDKAGQMAAALTYHTLFSILPMLVLGLIALNTFVDEDQRTKFKETAVTWTVEVLQGKDNGEPLDDPGGRRVEFEAVRESLDEKIQSFLNRLETVNYRSIGFVGLLVFIYAATGLLGTVENSFNDIYGVSSGRPWYVRLPLYYTVITLGPVVVLAGQWMQGRFIDFIQTGAWTNWLVGPAVVLIPVLAMWLVIFLMYGLLPNTSVAKRAAAVGSFVAAILLVASRELFGIYVSKTVVTTLYGALAVLPLFLLLLWIMWVITLFGLELTYTLDAMRDQRFKRERYKSQACELVDRALLLPLSLRVALAFQRGDAATAEELSHEIRVSSPAVRKLLRALEEVGVVFRVEDDRGVGFTLARPANTIRVADIMEAGEPRPDQAEALANDPAWRFVNRLRKNDRELTEETTLADLVVSASPETA